MRHFVIPARGGSKTVPDKNLQSLGGRPLIAWTIACAQAVAGAEDLVVVDSDDRKILDLAEGLGARPYLRPEHLGTDHATMRDVLKDYIEQAPEAQEVVLLYPTSPFRAPKTLRAAVALFQSRQAKSLMSVDACTRRPYGGVLIANGKMDWGVTAEAFYRKQDTPALYFANGAIYIVRRGEESTLNTQLFNAETVPFIMDGIEVLDVDTHDDLELCRALAETGRAHFPAAHAGAR